MSDLVEVLNLQFLNYTYSV